MDSRSGAGFLPYEKLMECTHCGLCLPFCPTYRELGVEMDSPRGRVYLVRALEENRVDVTEKLALHLDLCVGCRACETACPSGVSFGHILERGRFLLGRSSTTSGLFPRLLYQYLLPRKSRIIGLGRLLSIYQRSPLRNLALSASRSRFLPEQLLNAIDVLTSLPAVPEEISERTYRSQGERRLTAAFLICCMMRILLTDVNRATISVLNRSGCDVMIPRGQECCGALHAHAGRLEEARRLAMLNISVFEAAGVDVIVTNSAGCGAHMKEYQRLFPEDAEWREKARNFSDKVKDVSELLDSVGLSDGLQPLPIKVAYDDPCHLIHGQGIGEEPRNMLRRVPGLEIIELKESDWCCGSAGTYMLTQRDMALRLLRRKLQDIQASGADIVATGNPGCLLWIAWGLKKEGIPASCMHPVQILDMAYP
ncbi:MAG: (Fe-S)-binding protein [Thermoplasmata archaeon]